MAPELSARQAGRLGAALAVLVLVAGGFVVGRVTAAPDAGSEASGPAPLAPRPQSSPGAVDVGFAQDMATHHEQALLMAQLAITRGRAPVRSLGLSILGTQAQEVGLFRGWLRVWGEPAASASPMAWMGHAGPMPGMSTPAQLDRLYRSTGSWTPETSVSTTSRT